jgi:two-component system sensor kinase
MTSIHETIHRTIDREAANEPFAGRIVGGRYQLSDSGDYDRASGKLRAVDLETGEVVAVKAIPTRGLSPGVQMRLEHEAGLRRWVASEWLAPFLGLVWEDDFVFTMARCVEGVALSERMRQGPISLRGALTVGKCLFSALRDLHQLRVLHRDIRPDNVVVNVGTTITSATLLDFGAPESLRADALLREQGLETAWYLSPEQAGSLDRDVGETSDLYSAGVVLFHCLTGRPPFTGQDVGAVLFEHVTATVPELRSLGLEVPRALDEIVQRLLRKDPRDRYQLAEAVLNDLEALRRALDSGHREPSLVIGSRDRRDTLAEPAFVARAHELETLEDQVFRARHGQAALVLLEGRSGNGKTRLLTELAQRAARDGMWVLRGQATNEVGRRPFRLLEGVVERFLHACQNDPTLAESIRKKLGPQCDAVGAALPQLRHVLSTHRAADLAPEAFAEARTLRALGDFLEALGDEFTPVLLIFDDCQWADELTSKLIARWQAEGNNVRPAARHVMVIAAFRTEEVPADHLLRKLHAAAHVILEPLEPSDVRRLATSMAGALPEEAIEVVTRLAEGSPFMASAVLRGLVESGALVATPEGWRIEPLAMATQQSSRHAATVLAQRIALLPPATVELLSIGAILGKEFDLDTAARLASQQPSEAILAVDAARERQLVWARADGGRFVFVHDKIRSALLERLSHEQRRDLHLRAALHLQQTAPMRITDLAYHFDAAGASRNALYYALEAAEEARAQHSLEVAEQQYRIAQRGAELSDAPTRFRIAEGLGDVLMLRGRYDAAAALFEHASTLAEGRLAQANIREKIAELAFKRGDKETATREFEATLRHLGRTVPRSLPMFAVLLVWEAVIQVLHTVFSRWLVHRLRETPSEEIRLQLRLFSRLTHGYWFTRGKVQTLWAHLRGMNLGERYPPTLELANAYSEHAPVISLIPLFARACAYSRRSLEIRQQFGDLWGQGQSLTFYGCVLYYSSRYHECIEKSRDAIRLLERMGDYWLVHIARYQLAASLYHLGDLRGAVEACRLNHKSGLDLRDEQASGIILDVWTRATDGAVPESTLRLELQRDRHDPQGITQVLLAEGVRLMGESRLDRAVRTFREAIEKARRAGVCNAYTLPAMTWLATALRRQAEQTPPYQPRLRRAVLRQAQRAVQQAIFAARICANDLPQAWREYGLIQAMRGKPRQARSHFFRSLAIAEQHDARYEYAQTLLALGRLGEQFGWRDAEKHLVEAERLLQDLALAPSTRDSGDRRHSEPVTLSLADRFDTVVDAGRKIASALNAPAIFEESRAAALRLLRGERCRVIELDAQRGADGQLLDPLEVRLIARAVQTGRAVTLTDEAAGAAGDPHVVGESSAIGVPIYVRGCVVACLCVTHQHVRGLFGPDEERLADFIATLAGAALENAEGFQQLQTLNETLEVRVAERSAAAEARARELARSNEELERVANELRRTEEQLRVAIEAAESASRAKTQFLTTMSHEIRTPMNGILGMAELALKTSLTPQQRNYMNTVKQSGDTLLALLNDILDLSKIEAGRMDLEDIPFDPREVVASAVRLLAVNASQKGVELLCRVAPDLPAEISGDPTRLRQILVNLVGNAIKFTAEGEVFVNVFADDDGAQLHLEVQDTGIGIPQDKLETIFESFSQADSSTTRRYGGTGLGLAITAQLATLMGGRIWVESELGRGSTFHVLIPLRAISSHLSCQLTSTPLCGMRVLCHSDRLTARRVYAELLTQGGAAVQLTDENSVELNAVQGKPPYEAVVIDLADRPSASWRLLESSRTSPGWRDCPKILLTSAGKLCEIPGQTTSENEHWLAKPPTFMELADAMLSAVGRTRSVLRPDAQCATRQLDSLHILLAEDGLINQEVAVGLLELSGHTVQVANNGREAVEAYERGRFDVILMDLEMPEMDGFEATRRIRELQSISGDCTPIVAITAHAVNGFRERCLEGGMDDYATKPFDLEQLLKVLAAVTSNAPRADAAMV